MERRAPNLLQTLTFQLYTSMTLDTWNTTLLLSCSPFQRSHTSVPPYASTTSPPQIDTVTRTKSLGQVRDEISKKIAMKIPRTDHVLIKLGLSVPTAHLAALGSWDMHRNQAIRNVLRKARDGFNQFPRPW